MERKRRSIDRLVTWGGGKRETQKEKSPFRRIRGWNVAFANFNGSPRWIISIGIVTGVETPLQTRNSGVVHFTTSQTRSQTVLALFIAAWFSRACFPPEETRKKQTRSGKEEVAARIKANSPSSTGSLIFVVFNWTLNAAPPAWITLRHV